MKTKLIKLTAALTGAGASSAYAASSGVGGEGSGMLVWFLIWFGVMVIMLQAVPALIMFVSMVKGLFSGHSETHLPKVGR